MSQNNYNLMNGETIIAEAQFHYFLYWLPALLVLLAVVLPFLPLQAPVKYMLYCSGALLVVALLWIVALNNGKRYILTNKRIIKKTGIIQRETAELMLRKIEAGIKNHIQKDMSSRSLASRLKREKRERELEQKRKQEDKKQAKQAKSKYANRKGSSHKGRNDRSRRARDKAKRGR